MVRARLLDGGDMRSSLDAIQRRRLRIAVNVLRKDDAVRALLDSCNSVGEAYLFGGQVRDAVFGASGPFGDVDIFVSGPLDSELAIQLSRISRRTNLGGMRLAVGKFDVDIWELPRSYAFRLSKAGAVSISGLLSAVCFTTDAAAVSLKTGRLVAAPFFLDSAKRRTLGFVVPPVSVEILPAVRVARLVVRLGVRPSEAVSRYFLSALEMFSVEGIVSAEARWKGRRVLDATLVENVARTCRGGDLDSAVGDLFLP